MSRLLSETTGWLPEKSEKEKLKEEIRGEVIKELKKKKRRRTLGCCLIEILSLLIVLFLGVTALAETGLFKIPFFSNFYTPPQPIREVVLGEEVKEIDRIIEQKIKKQIEEKMKPGITDQEIEIELIFSENELTAFLEKSIKSGLIPLEFAQIAITPREAEFFGKLKEPLKAILTVRVKPEFKDNQLTLKFTKFKLGNLPLPAFVGNFLFEKFMNEQLNWLLKTIAKGKIKNIELENEKLKIREVVNVMILYQQSQH
jgi:hypothetical protein